MTTSESQQLNRTSASLNDRNLQEAAATYPPEVQGPVFWLGVYLREECSGRYDVLADRVRKLGFHNKTDTFFSKVIRGKYFAPDGKGGVTGSVKNTLQIIDALKRDSALSSSAGRRAFIETSTWLDIKNFIDLKRASDTVCKFGVLIGPTGSQKTAALKHYCELNNHGLCVHIEAPENGSLAQFLSDLAGRFGFGHASAYNARRNISSVMNEKRTIIIDNVQRLYRKDHGNDQPIFHFVQKLQDDTGCTIILAIAALEKSFLIRGTQAGFFEQFEGRAGGRRNFLELPDYAPREDVIAIAESFGVSTENPAALKYLESISREPGRVRILFDALQTASRLAQAKKVPLTLELLKESRGEITALEVAQ